MTTSGRRSDAIAPDVPGRLLFAAVLAVGVGLRAWQVFYNAPLWLDELTLTNGILGGSFAGLFDGTADFAQAAPPGFLAIEWAIVRLFPASDLALRIPSLLFASGAIVATWMAAREVSGERDAWVAAGLVALASQLIFQGGQVKPYAADALLAPLIVWCALRHDRTASRSSWRALFAVGATAPLISFGAVFVLAGAGCFLLLRGAHRRGWAPLVAMGTAWGASALVSVTIGRRMLSPEANEMMGEYWSPWYPPFPPSSAQDVVWFPTKMVELLYVMMGLREVWIFGLGLLAGAALAWRQRPGASVLLATPLAAGMVAAIIRQYPFGQRLWHWSAPLLALLLGVVASLVAGWLRPRLRLAALIPGAFMLGTPVLSLAASPPPYLRDNITPVIEHLSEAARPGDVLFVSWGAWHSWQRYGPRLRTPLGKVIFGGCPRDYPRGYLRDLDTLRGTPRAWLIFARVEAREWPVHRARLSYLDSIGGQAESLLVEAPGINQSARVDLYRYDLSDSSRLGRANAESFPVPEDLIRTETGCYRFDAMYLRADGTRAVRIF